MSTKHYKVNEKIEITEIDQNHKQLFLLSGGKIFCYFPFRGVQVLFYDIHSSEIPDLWELGFRKVAEGRYLRALICRSGCCDFTVDGITQKLSADQAMFDYSMVDKGDFTFTSEYFKGVEITIQSTLINENTSYRKLRKVIKAMSLPEQEIRNCNGYIFAFSPNTERIIDEYLKAGFSSLADIINIGYTLVIGHRLGNDLKTSKTKVSDKQMLIAEDIHRCLTDEFATKWTAQIFADKYGVSDTTVKSYFKRVYGYGFKEYQIKVRMEYAAQMLATSKIRIVDLSLAVGFTKCSMFTKAFKDYFGVTPSEYRLGTRTNS